MKKRLKLPFIVLICLLTALCACSKREAPIGYNVRFETGNDYFIPSVTAVSIDEEPEPKIDGYVLEGWYEDEEFSVNKRVNFPFYPKNDCVLYAKYIDLTVGNEEITYEMSDGGGSYEVAAYGGFSANIVIPESRNGLPVTKLQVGFIKNSSYLKKLYFYSPESIEETFYFCYGFKEFVKLGEGGGYTVIDGVLYDASGETLLSYPISKSDGSGKQKKFTLPSDVKKIAEDALKNAIYLEELVFSENVTDIDEAFRTLSSLKSIKTSNNPNFYTDNGVLYSGNKTMLLSCPISIALDEYALINETEYVVDEAFERCKLKKITFNKNLKKFGLHSELEYLESFSVPAENAAYFSVGGVLYTVGGELVKYPAQKPDEEYACLDKLTSIGSFAFNGAIKLKSLSVNVETKLIKNAVSFSAYAFGGGNGIGLEEIRLRAEKEGFDVTFKDDALADCGDVNLILYGHFPPKFTTGLPIQISKVTVPFNLIGFYQEVYPNLSDILSGEESMAVTPGRAVFHTDGGGELAERICAYIVTEPKITKSGFVFGGWYAERECVNKIEFPCAVSGTVEFFARWIEE